MSKINLAIAVAFGAVLLSSNYASAQAVVTASGTNDPSKATAGAFCAKRTVGGVQVAVDLVHTPAAQALARLQTMDFRALSGLPMQINTYPALGTGSTNTVLCNDGGVLLPGVDFVN
jgi:hypothetical protein